MSAILLDTHTWVWALFKPERLSAAASEAIKSASTVLVSPITFFEITNKVRLGKWAGMAPYAPELPAILRRQAGQLLT